MILDIDSRKASPDNGFTLAATASGGAGQYVDVTSLIRPISSICGIAPDKEGRFRLIGSDCYVTRIADSGTGFSLSFDCPPPGCCGSYEDLYRYLTKIIIQKFLIPATESMVQARDKTAELANALWYKKYNIDKINYYGSTGDAPSAPSGILSSSGNGLKIVACPGTNFSSYGADHQLAGLMFVGGKVSQSVGKRATVQAAIVNESNAAASVSVTVTLTASDNQEIGITEATVKTSSGDAATTQNEAASKVKSFTPSVSRSLKPGEWIKINLMVTCVDSNDESPASTRITASINGSGSYTTLDGEHNIADWSSNLSVYEDITP